MGRGSAGKRCIKFLLFSFNVTFWLAGLAAVGIGIWMIFDPGRFDEFLGKYTFVIPGSILIAAGLFVVFVGFCGCVGAIRENKCLLGTYFTMLLLIFCTEIAAGVLAFLFRDKLECCGAEGPGDYDGSEWRNSNKKSRPESCCSVQSKCLQDTDPRVVYKKGCIDELVDFTKENLVILGGIGIGLACVQLLGMCFSCCLFFSIDDSYGR